MPEALTNVIDAMGQPLILLFVANIFLLLFAPWIAELIEGGELDESTRKFRILVMRSLNLLVIVILGITLVTGQTQIINNFIVKLLLAIVVVYVSVVLTLIISRLIRMRYGRRIQSQGEARIADTYASRALGISAGIFIGIVALISIVRLFGFDDLLETGGVIGFIGVFLALTQGAWAPDIISGLVILNTRMLVERDVIKLYDGNEEIFARVHRTRAFHTELLNLVDNHRIMISNSKIREYTLHNLSKFATAKGLRESLFFKLGYDVSALQVRQMFDRVFELACEKSELDFEHQHLPEVRLQDAGDHAVEWSFHYYTKDLESVVALRLQFRELVFEVAQDMHIDLSTPFVVAQPQHSFQ